MDFFYDEFGSEGSEDSLDPYGYDMGFGGYDSYEDRGQPDYHSYSGAQLLSEEELRQLCEHYGLPSEGSATKLRTRLLNARQMGLRIPVGVPPASTFKSFFGVAPLAVPLAMDSVAPSGLCPDPYAIEEEHDSTKKKLQKESAKLIKELVTHSSPFVNLGNVDATLAAPLTVTPVSRTGDQPKSLNIAMPVAKTNFGKLWSRARAAPFGHGTETILDPSVRNCRYFDANEFSIDSADWQRTFSTSSQSPFLEALRLELAPNTTQITSRLYKMVLYREGCFFKPHLDTQRSQDMFGTLVIEIGSGWFPPGRSGSLVIRSTDGREVTMGKGSFAYAAFFADCEHEVLKLVSKDSYRVVLVYNLHRTGMPVSIPKVDNQAPLVNGFRKLLKAYPGLILAWTLQHKYGVVSIGPRFLKGRDAQIFQALDAADDLEVLVCPIHVHRYGSGGYDEPQNAEVLMEDVEPDLFRVDSFPIDPLVSKPTGFGVLSRKPLQSMNVFFLEDGPKWSVKALSQVQWTGNEGSSGALLYAHGAIFVKLRDTKKEKTFYQHIDETEDKMAKAVARKFMSLKPPASHASDPPKSSLTTARLKKESDKAIKAARARIEALDDPLSKTPTESDDERERDQSYILDLLDGAETGEANVAGETDMMDMSQH